MRIWLNEKARVKMTKPGTPVRHRDLPSVVGVISAAFYDAGALYYNVDWIEGEGFAPTVRSDHVRILPSALHLLAHVG